MTLDEFLEELAEHRDHRIDVSIRAFGHPQRFDKVNWQLTTGRNLFDPGVIRASDTDPVDDENFDGQLYCPVTLLAQAKGVYESRTLADVWEAGKALGMSDEDTRTLVYAADDALALARLADRRTKAAWRDDDALEAVPSAEALLDQPAAERSKAVRPRLVEALGIAKMQSGAYRLEGGRP